MARKIEVVEYDSEWEKKFKSRKVLERKLFEITNKKFSIW